MSDLQNLTPANTYKGLLQVGDYTNGVDSTVRSVLDGEGTASALAISTTKVGIGTTSPTQELEVNGDIVSTTLTASGAVTAGSVSTSGAVGAGSIDVGGNVVADEYALDQVGSSSSAVAIHAPATNELAIRTNSAERLRVDSSGNIAIGTTNPDSNMHIEGGGGLAVTKIKNTTSGDASVKLENTVGQLAIANQDGKLNIIDNTSGSPEERMTVDTSGNIGIGTTSPLAPLDVTSTTGGVIMPRMTTTEMNAIFGATDGEMIYNTTANKFYGRANNAWVALH